MVHLVRQDLSVAGKRAGLSGERSGLFMEQIRIIKEMREKDAESGRTGADIRPRFMVYEAETARTIDTSGGNPACNQGGMVIVELAQDHDKESPRREI